MTGHRRLALIVSLLGPVTLRLSLVAVLAAEERLVLLPDLLLVDERAADVVAAVDQLSGQVGRLEFLLESLDFLKVFWLGEQMGLL